MDTKERIRLRAQELFMQYGIRSVSMDDIATQLGMSKKTIYQFFADKDELVEAVVTSEIGQMQGDCMDCTDQAVDAVDEIFLMMDKIDAQIRPMNPMIMYDLEKFHFKAFQQFMQHKNKFLIDMIRKNMEWGISGELYRPELNVDVISKFRLESVMIPFNIGLFAPSRYNLADVTQEILEHYIYGLVTPKGYKLIQKYKQERTKKISSNAKTK
jgi:AcrR family transcriptional regulator